MKLAKLPDRTTIKITFNTPNKLNDDLKIYASLYRDAYGDDSSVPELIPQILETFLKSDSAFTKAQKDGSLIAAVEKQAPPPFSPNREGCPGRNQYLGNLTDKGERHPKAA